MKNIQIEHYEDLILYNIETDEVLELPDLEATNIRVKIPAVEKLQMFWSRKGFFHADRMLKASINLKRNSIDLQKKIRFDVKKTSDYRQEILDIALKSFPVDRRFHVDEHCNEEKATKIITAWVDSIDEFFVCFFKGVAVGFAALEEKADGVYEIRLAAVDENYRMSGAAISLYAFLVQHCKDIGGKILYGWISSVNMAVMNLYVSLGATFSEPSDIFLKEIKN